MVSHGNEKGVCVYYNVYGHDNIIIYRVERFIITPGYTWAVYITHTHAHTHTHTYTHTHDTHKQKRTHTRLRVGVAETQEAVTGPRRGVRAIHHGNKYHKKK